MNESSAFIQSVDRAVAILDAIAAAGEAGISLRDLSRGVQVNPSTTHHLVSTLIRRRVIEQDPETRRYRLGLHLIELGSAALHTTSLARIAQPYLDQVSGETSHTVTLMVFHGLLRTPLLVARSRQLLTARSAPLEVSTLHATGSGKLLLAYLPEQDFSGYLAFARLERYTATTLTDPEALKMELAKIRADGFSIDNEEYGSGVDCISAPFQDASRRVVGCFDLVFPSYVQDRETIGQMAAVLTRTAQDLSRRLGEIGLHAA